MSEPTLCDVKAVAIATLDTADLEATFRRLLASPDDRIVFETMKLLFETAYGAPPVRPWQPEEPEELAPPLIAFGDEDEEPRP